MKFLIKNILKFAAVGAIIASGACTDEFMVSEETDNSDGSKGLSFVCGDMLEVFTGPNNEATRAGGTKTEEEKKINTLHVFFFNAGGDGELLTAKYDNFAAYQKFNLKTGNDGIDRFFLKLTEGERNNAAQLFKDKAGNEIKSNIRVVAIANIDALDIDLDDPNYETATRFLTKYSESGKIQKAGRTITEDFWIEKYSDLEEWVYYPKIRMNEDGTTGDITKLPEAGMPMIGEEIIDLSKQSAIVVNMKALMAKVNVAVKLDPDQFTDNLPTLSITEYGVLNMPIAVPFKQPEGKPVNGWKKSENLTNYFKDYDVTQQPMFHKNGTPSNWDSDHSHCDPANHEFTNKLADPIRILKGAEAQLICSYYTFENINMPDYTAKRAGVDGQIKDAFTGTGASKEFEANYPKGVDPKDYQRWKSTIAYKDRASAMILKGEYTTHQGLKYNAQFTIYLGMDTDKDFKVKRNHKYDNNIVIKGLDIMRNSVDDVYTFDGRVNVVDDNPVYLAIVNERKVDVHATALPMDIWLMDVEKSNGVVDYNTDIEFEIPEDARDWMQMVYISREEMRDATGRFYAGAGIEPYFYDKLLDDIKARTVLTKNDMGGIGYPGHKSNVVNGLEYGAQCGSKVTMRSTPQINNSRSRIYFYIDENTKDWKYDKKGECTGTPDRSVKVKIKYKSYRLDERGDTLNVIDERFRTIEIEQRGLLRVKGPWYSSHYLGTVGYKGEPIDETFIEYYEEYLNHTDPLDEHVSGDVYEGLAWGLDGISFPNKVDGMSEGQTVNAMRAYDASLVTNWIIDYTEKNVTNGSMSNVRLFDRKNKPLSAIHYCYGKNKRNYKGTAAVEESSNDGYYGWYMPGIKELETALLEYYETFGDFQNKFYWSCAPAANNSDYTSDHYARSTKVKVSSKVEYVESDPGKTGYKERTEELRIRAFYRRNPKTQK